MFDSLKIDDEFEITFFLALERACSFFLNREHAPFIVIKKDQIYIALILVVTYNDE